MRFFTKGAIVALALIHATAPAVAQSWFENCGSSVRIDAVASRTKADGRPWDGPLATPGRLAEQAPDLTFCAGPCSEPCVDSFQCSAIVYDPGAVIYVYDKDLIVPDPVGGCKWDGSWICSAMPGSRVTARQVKRATCESDFAQHLRRAEQAGCDAQIAIWSRAALFRLSDQIVLRRVGQILRRNASFMGASLGDLLGDFAKRSNGAGMDGGAEAIALELATKRQWLPEDYLVFALLLKAASETDGAEQGLYPFMNPEVIRGCQALID